MDWDQALIAYHDLSDYFETGSVTRARKFITACIRLIGAPDRGSSFGDELVFPSKAELRKQITDAKDFIASKNTDATPNGRTAAHGLLDFTRYRE